MKRLADHSLIYGRMMEVAEAFEIERYNSALRGFGLPETKLERFRIDMTGFSPEVADELGDPQYLDPNGINRRFIVISPEQQSLPVVHTAFSNTEELMHQFFKANARAINAITIKDACYGEIEDSVYLVDELTDLLNIETVEFKVKTGQDLTGKANELRASLDRLRKSDDLWRDDTALNSMVDLAKDVGDIRQNEIVPREVVFKHDAFWTSHFGGIYVFFDDRKTTVIGRRDAPGFRKANPWTTTAIDLSDRGLVLKFLIDTGRVEWPRGSWIEKSGFLDHRIQMRLAHIMAQHDPDFDFDRIDQDAFRSWAYKNARELGDDRLLKELRYVETRLSDWSELDDDDVSEEALAALLRAKPGRNDQWLVNRLLSDYVGWDFITRFVFNKQGFYADWPNYGDTYGAYITRRLTQEYLADKEGLRDRLYAID
jgi:hypothetical protein